MLTREKIIELCDSTPNKNIKEILGVFYRFLGKTKFEELRTTVATQGLSLSQWIYNAYYDITIPICPVCQVQECSYKSFSKGYQKNCSSLCNARNQETKKKKRETNIVRYGVDNPMKDKTIAEKLKQNNIQKYGVDNPLKNEAVKQRIQKKILEKYGYISTLSIPTVRNKINKTIKEKYSVNNISQNENIKKKKRETTLKNYGVEVPMKSLLIKQRARKKNIDKYGVDNPMKLKENKERYSFRNREVYLKRYKEILWEYILLDKELETQLQEYIFWNKNSLEKNWIFTCKFCKKEIKDSLRKVGTTDNLIPYTIPRCIECNPLHESAKEKEIRDYIEFFWIKTLKADRTILNGKELDIYIPEKNLAIEFDGLIYHSFGKHKNKMFDNSFLEQEKKNYHLEKTELCESRNIHLLHIFENEWINPVKKDIWKSIISWKLQQNTRLFARNLILDSSVSSSESKRFLEENHLQGYVPSSIRIWLRNKEWELISLMTFWKSRYWKEYTYELLRFVTKKYKVIVGGASKIFKYFKENILLEWESIITYADRRYSQGNVYEKLNMTPLWETKPNYFYLVFNKYILHNRVSFQKHKLKDKLKEFDINLTETENMYNNGYRKIYDCWNKKYIYIKIKS